MLRRYTSLPALLRLLRNRQITLLNPASWEDRNDALFMSEYKRRNGLKSVLALCFSEANETYHHWRVFTRGSEGVCIAFKRKELLAAFDRAKGIRKEAVEYKLIKQMEGSSLSVAQLPFLKRRPYKDEREFRIVYFDRKAFIDAKEFDIDLNVIHKITLNPGCPRLWPTPLS
jgi:hypothetical protein